MKQGFGPLAQRTGRDSSARPATWTRWPAGARLPATLQGLSRSQHAANSARVPAPGAVHTALPCKKRLLRAASKPSSCVLSSLRLCQACSLPKTWVTGCLYRTPTCGSDGPRPTPTEPALELNGQKNSAQDSAGLQAAHRTAWLSDPQWRTAGLHPSLSKHPHSAGRHWGRSLPDLLP